MDMRTRHRAIEMMYTQLRSFLEEYAETDRFNLVPKGVTEDDAAQYVERRLRDIRATVIAPLEEESDLPEKLRRIWVETEYFTKQYEVPGVVQRWKQIDPDLIFFDAAFDLMDEEPEIYDSIKMGLYPFHLNCYPDEAWVQRRKVYFSEVEERYALTGREFSEKSAFQDELCRALELVFQEDFGTDWQHTAET